MNLILQRKYEIYFLFSFYFLVHHAIPSRFEISKFPFASFYSGQIEIQLRRLAKKYAQCLLLSNFHPSSAIFCEMLQRLKFYFVYFFFFTFEIISSSQNLLSNNDNCHNSTASYFRCYLAELDPLLVSLTKTDNNTEKALNCLTSSGCREPDLSINTHLVSISGPDAENFTRVLNCFIETGHQMVSAALDYVTKNMGIIGLDYDTVKKIQLTDRNPITNARVSEIIHINTVLEDESLCTEEQRQAAVDCIEKLEKSDEQERQKIQQSICKMKYECFSGIESPCQESVHFNRMSLSQLACGALKFSKFNEQLSSCVGWSVTPEVEPFIDHVLNDLAEPLCEMFILFSDSCS